MDTVASDYTDENGSYKLFRLPPGDYGVHIQALDGSVLDVRDSLNRAYYGKAVTPVDILVKREASNKHADALRAAVAAQAR